MTTDRRAQKRGGHGRGEHGGSKRTADPSAALRDDKSKGVRDDKSKDVRDDVSKRVRDGGVALERVREDRSERVRDGGVAGSVRKSKRVGPGRPKVKPPTKKELADVELQRMLNDPMSQCRALEGLPQLNFSREAMRLGFPVKVMGGGGLKTSDTRRWQANPHLRVSLGYLCDVLQYLRKHGIHMYRMSSDIAPYATHPDMPQFHSMVKESAGDLAAFGRYAREADVRLSFHPSQFIVLNSENETLTKKSMWDLDSQAEMLDLMACGPEAVMVVHVGGAYGDRESGWRRWAETWKRLSEPVRRRLVLENDDIRFSASDVLKVHEATGVKCVWDYQHHWCFNPEGLPLVETLEKFCATWPGGVRPKMHFSCARTEMRELKRKNRKTGKNEMVLQPPIWTGHADYNNPFETITFLRSIQHVDVDVMLESKAKDLSLIRLRNDMAKYAPELAARYGVDAQQASEDVGEVVETEDAEEEVAVA